MDLTLNECNYWRGEAYKATLQEDKKSIVLEEWNGLDNCDGKSRFNSTVTGDKCFFGELFGIPLLALNMSSKFTLS